MPDEKIVILSGDEQTRAEMARLLRQEGFCVEGVATQEAAQRLVAVMEPRVLFIDLRAQAEEMLAALQQILSVNPNVLAVGIIEEGMLRPLLDALRAGVVEFVLRSALTGELRESVLRVLERERWQREANRLRALVPLYELSQAFMSDFDLSSLLEKIIAIGLQETGAHRGSIMLLDESGTELRIRAAVGLPKEVVATQRARIGEGIAGWVAKTGKALVLNNETVPDFLRSSLRGGRAVSAVSLPLSVRGRVIGVMNLTKETTERPFTRSDADLLSVLAGQAAIAIENARLFEQREAAYAELSRLDHLKSEFINIAAHELRTPAALILGFTTLLAEEVSGDRKLSELVRPLVNNAERLSRLVSQLFEASTLEVLDTSQNLQPLPLLPVLEQVIEQMRDKAAAKKQNLQLLPTDAELWAMADRDRVERILDVLLSNAIKFTPDEGQITVEAREHGSDVIVKVCDTGTGIPVEERERIFKRFYQVEPSLTRRHEGLGLGLPIARALAEAMGGHLWVANDEERAERQGATFCLSLPLAAAQDGDGTANPRRA
ncbi:MAG TPA: GAF domain-containing protein [Anaerolineae bacterium]|nr:GAF domain-containing protein [Anaerolineae bacterium]